MTCASNKIYIEPQTYLFRSSFFKFQNDFVYRHQFIQNPENRRILPRFWHSHRKNVKMTSSNDSAAGNHLLNLFWRYVNKSMKLEKGKMNVIYLIFTFKAFITFFLHIYLFSREYVRKNMRKNGRKNERNKHEPNLHYSFFLNNHGIKIIPVFISAH